MDETRRRRFLALAEDSDPQSAGAREETTRAEAELVTRARDGDGRAFADLVRPHLELLYRLSWRACGDSELAQDAVQETLTIVYERLGRYRPGTSLRAFVASIAIRRAHTLARSERRRRLREEVSAPASRPPSPEEVAAAADLGRRIRGLLARMPKKRRAAALLRLEGRLTYAEIASALGTSEGSARVLVHLAVKELRQRLGETP